MIAVVPLVGTWIETGTSLRIRPERIVVPLVGTWIETTWARLTAIAVEVVPLVGTWIETILNEHINQSVKSFPLWERGLKHFQHFQFAICQRRSPCGNVD